MLNYLNEQRFQSYLENFFKVGSQMKCDYFCQGITEMLTPYCLKGLIAKYQECGHFINSSDGAALLVDRFWGGVWVK